MGDFQAAVYLLYGMIAVLLVYLLYQIYKGVKYLGIGAIAGTKAVLSQTWNLLTNPDQVTVEQMFTPGGGAADDTGMHNIPLQDDSSTSQQSLRDLDLIPQGWS
jgi:hypothetical protein